VPGEMGIDIVKSIADLIVLPEEVVKFQASKPM
jgi:hypothetical protein